MRAADALIAGPASMTVHVPMIIRRTGGRKLVIAPEGSASASVGHTPRANNPMVKAVARAFHWRLQIENGRYATIAELAATERLNPSYVSRVLRLTLLAPDIIEAILDGRQTAELTLAMLMEPFPSSWREQTESRFRRR